MTILSLLSDAIAVLVCAAALAYLFTPAKALSGLLAGLGGTVGCVMAAAAGGMALLGAQSVSGTIPLIQYQVLVTPLSAVWLITLGVCGGFTSLYNIQWHRHDAVKANGLLINLLMAAALCAVSAANFGALVVMAEIMALSAVFLTGCSESGKLWFAMGRLGTVLLAIACWLLWQRYHTLSLLLLSAQTPGSDIWLLGVIGFGLLAGIIPLHAWVPQAHANAPAPAAALFSTVVMKIGLFGILSLSLLGGQPPLWWGVLLLVLGMVTAFVGGLYALMEHNIQRLLAYHTLENIGIILLGLGVGVTGLALRQPALIALGLTGGLYHLFNHSLFKSTLFLGAGALWFGTGYRDIEKLGGIGKRMPVISLAMLVGLMAMAALPPLNGFAGEWVIYQSFFRLSASGAFSLQLIGPLLAVGLAITGALAVMCMAKVYGVTFLGAPRTPQAENPHPVPWLMTACVAALALCCVAGGVAAPWLLPRLFAAVPLPLQTANTLVSPPMIALLLIATPLLPLLLMMVFKGDRLPARSRGTAWVCGYDHEASMVVTAHGFAMPVKTAFAPVLKLRKWLEPTLPIPGWRADAAPLLFRRLALIELAVLVVVVISRGA
ncbi:formate hydrogenlyase subunit 3 [Kosakonia sp. ML.JS2a]|uniref:formate hydrogenlyase subunit 3 n=1 Tax=Kosakonia sp. ML.JS2a TaxID=2980557 RepID=UPI0021DB45EE|nr:formate hydrogenlyase subunit 3 [Kosakonia sp. ML.JS2a]UXY11932.1 formate hydrogenlyase subunit 3 [Kosakonia sp. ML.JS2a]